MEAQQYIKISEFSDYIKRALENNNDFKNVCVKGEIANLTHNKSGHIYFSLKDPESKIDCAIWKSNAPKFLNLSINEGSEVIAVGNISYYKPSGKITFVIHDIKIDGVGALAIEYEKRLNEVHERGWSDSIHKKPIPKIPNNIGIITAATGDAVRDLISNMKRRYNLANIYLFPTLVQGDGAANDIANKIKFANQFQKKLDVLIVGRGGGSYEDLWAFNEWPVLEAIFNSQVPIITGIGHEPDITIADYIADKRASTPTAAGEYATPDIAVLHKSLQTNKAQLASILQNKLTILAAEFQNLNYSLVQNINAKVLNTKNNFKHTVSLLEGTVNNRIKSLLTQLTSNSVALKEALGNKLKTVKSAYIFQAEKLELLNPIKPLERGFSILKQDNKIIRNIEQLDQSKEVVAQLIDGTIDMSVLKARKDQ